MHQLLWTECLCSSRMKMRGPGPHGMGSAGGAFGRHLELDEVMRWGLMMGFVSLEGEEDTRVLSLPHEDTGGGGWLETGRGSEQNRLHWQLPSTPSLSP